MAEKHSKSEGKISKAERRYQVGYVRARHEDRTTGIARYYSQHPSLQLKGDWLKEAGFNTGTGVTVKISEGCIVLMADNSEVQELREQLYQAKQVVKVIIGGMFSVLNES